MLRYDGRKHQSVAQVFRDRRMAAKLPNRQSREFVENWMETTLVLVRSCSIFSNISLERMEVNIQVYWEASPGIPDHRKC